MIIITTGTFGMRKGEKVIPVTKENGPISLETNLEERLIREGIAKRVESGPAPAERETETDQPIYNESMKLSELKEAAARLGIDPSGMKSKAEIIDAIEDAQAEEDEEDFPDLDVEEVQ